MTGPAPIPLADDFNPRIARAARIRVTLDVGVAVIAAVAVMAVACFSQRVFIDGDTNWHVAAGRWILEHRTVPRTDPFSYTFVGKPWVAHEWLAEVLMALAYFAAGWNGVVLLVGLAAGLAFAMIAAELRLWLGPFAQAIGLALTFACLSAFLYARPHILALPLLVFWTRAILAARREGRAPSLWLTPLMILWANLHASFIFGFAVLAPFALEALIEAKDKVRVAVRWGLFGVLALAFCLVTPHGLAGLEFPFQVVSMKILPNILEWRGATFETVTPFETALIVTLFLGLWRGIRAPPLRLLLLAALVHMGLQHVRQQAVLAGLAPLLLAEPFGRALAPARDGPRPGGALTWADLRRYLPIPAAGVLAFAAAGVIAFRLATPLVRADNVNVPVTAVANIPPGYARLPVFNEYAFGGYLIFKGIRPYVDGRADMYGDDFVREYLAVLLARQPDVDREFTRWNIRWTVLSPRGALVKLLDSAPNWRRVYSDRWAVVQVAADGAPSAPQPPLSAPSSATQAAPNPAPAQPAPQRTNSR